DVAAALQRGPRGVGELAILDGRVRRLHKDTPAGAKAATPDRRAGADPAQRRDGIAHLQGDLLLQDHVVDQVRLRRRTPVLPERGDLRLQLRRMALAELRDLRPSERAECSLITTF